MFYGFQSLFIFISRLPFSSKKMLSRCFTLLSAGFVLLCIGYNEDFISALVLLFSFHFFSVLCLLIFCLCYLVFFKLELLVFSAPEAALILVKLIVFHLQALIVALFIKASIWKQLKCPSTD